MKTFTLTYGAGHQVLINVPAERIVRHFDNLPWSGFRVQECGTPDAPVPAGPWLEAQFALPLLSFIYSRRTPTTHIGVLASGPIYLTSCRNRRIGGSRGYYRRAHQNIKSDICPACLKWAEVNSVDLDNLNK